ncbi:4Fe-4S binding protein [Neobacillus sp. WH10]|uniref:DUF362 domain-containing protein n=1 Tax=Neobacillus sp. WH10 TaxID=3047873 RepID=UPI0024C1765A|nr:4Fe-4S dicluster domain-containing protein [Neobacillus sp. WH10]WHY75662.1 4Fe-4S binding protein [Neobacillus sp. WH10]
MSMFVNWLESLHVDLNITNKCSRKRNIRSTCSICFDGCKYNALTINQQKFEIISERCTSCGDCIISCPLSAIEGMSASREFENGSLIYDEGYTPSVKELLIYKKRGLHSIIIAGNSLNPKWEIVINQANRKLKFLGQNPIIVLKDVNEETLSRRNFFTSIQKEGKQLAKRLAPVEWKKEANEWKLTKYYPDYQFYTVEIDQNKCILCQACFSFCLEKVFSIRDTIILIENEKCVNCKDCTDICPEHAIEINPDIKKRSEIHATFHIKECRDCGKLFHTFQLETEKCHICKDRDPEWLSPYL